MYLPRLPAGPLRRAARSVRARLPELNFITLHYIYFIFMSLVSAVIFWGSSDPSRSVSFIDSLFLTTSAMTEAGLNTVNLSELTTWQQVMLFILIIMGSAIFVSAFVLFVRLKAFERAFVSLRKDRLDKRLKRRHTAFSRTKSIMRRKNTNAPPVPESLSANAHSQMRHQLVNPVLDEEATLGNSSNESSETNRDPHPIIIGPRDSEKVQDDSHEGHADRPQAPRVGFSEDTKSHRRTNEEYQKMNKPLISFTGVGAIAKASIRLRSGSAPLEPSISRAAPLPGPYTSNANAYFTSGGWISRNSQFHGLSTDERLLLGGFEYKAVVFLSILVPLYLILWQGLGAIALGAWVANHRVNIALEDGIGPWWVGSFNAVSAFNNSGMSLLDANMVAFQNAIFMLISMALFILAGNTAYPIFLRAAVWTMWKLIPSDDPNWLDDKQTLRFLLDHPRRVYTNMFPSRHTWWLAVVLILINGIDWAFFPILNIGNHAITDLTPGIEVIDGLFQAVAVRSGGFYVVPIPSTRISLQFLYVIMMYFSVYPVVISMRNSNVYEERSLGVFAEDIEDRQPNGASDSNTAQTATDPLPKKSLKRRMTDFGERAAPAAKRETRSYFVRQQVRAQLAHDAWFLVFAIFLILIIEAAQFEANPVSFSVFNVIFEVVSAYATVGISVGVPNKAYSFSGNWHTLSKLVLIIVMLRGRHRGLPVAIDHAVQLPGAHLYEAEAEDGETRLGKLERANTLRSPTSAASPRRSDPLTSFRDGAPPFVKIPQPPR